MEGTNNPDVETIAGTTFETDTNTNIDFAAPSGAALDVVRGRQPGQHTTPAFTRASAPAANSCAPALGRAAKAHVQAAAPRLEQQ